MSSPRSDAPRPLLREGVDFYREGPYVVFTATYLRERGYCCDSGCRHCPWKDDLVESEESSGRSRP